RVSAQFGLYSQFRFAVNNPSSNDVGMQPMCVARMEESSGQAYVSADDVFGSYVHDGHRGERPGSDMFDFLDGSGDRRRAPVAWCYGEWFRRRSGGGWGVGRPWNFGHAGWRQSAHLVYEYECRGRESRSGCIDGHFRSRNYK